MPLISAATGVFIKYHTLHTDWEVCEKNHRLLSFAYLTVFFKIFENRGELLEACVTSINIYLGAHEISQLSWKGSDNKR